MAKLREPLSPCHIQSSPRLCSFLRQIADITLNQFFAFILWIGK
jgi:hypothetical protein